MSKQDLMNEYHIKLYDGNYLVAMLDTTQANSKLALIHALGECMADCLQVNHYTMYDTTNNLFYNGDF